MKKRFCFRWPPLASLIAFSLGFALTAGVKPAQATNLYWDTNGTTTGTATTANTGTWGTSNFFNSDPTGGAGGAFTTTTTSNDDVFFYAGNTTVANTTITLSGTLSAKGITVQSGATGLTLSGNAASASLSIYGDGITDNSNSALTLGSTTASANTPINIAAAQTWANNGTGTMTVNSPLAVSNQLTLGGTGLIAFGSLSAGSGTGGVKIDGATVQVSGAAGTAITTFGTVAGSTLTLNSGSLRAFTTNDVTVGNAFAITGGFTFAPSTSSSRHLILTGGGGISNAPTVTLSDTAGSGTQITTGAVTLNSNVTFIGAGVGTITSNIGQDAMARSVTYSGTGTLTLGGANSFSGGVTLNSGTLNINSATALGATAGTFTIAGGTTINNTTGGALTLANNNPEAWNGDFTFTGTNALNLGTGAVALAPNRTENVTVTANTLTVGGVVTDNGGGIAKAGAGTLALTGNSGTTYTGNTTINAGTLSFANGSLGNGNGMITFGGNATLQWAAGNTQDISNKALSSTGYTGTLDLNGNNVTFATANGLTGSGNFTKAAASTGVLTLAAANNLTGIYTAATTGGATLLKNTNALQNATVSLLTGITNGGVLFDSSVATYTFGNLTGAGNLALQDNAGTPNPIALTVGGNNGSTTYTGVLSGAGSLTKVGTGTLTLTATNTFSGGLNVLSGIVSAANSAFDDSFGGTSTIPNAIVLGASSGSANSTIAFSAASNINNYNTVSVTAGNTGVATIAKSNTNVTGAGIGYVYGLVTLHDHDLTVASGTGGGTISLVGGITIADATSGTLQTVTVTGAAGASFGAGASDGNGKLQFILNGTGNTIFSGANSFTGDIFVNSGSISGGTGSGGNPANFGNSGGTAATNNTIHLGDASSSANVTFNFGGNGGVVIPQNFDVRGDGTNTINQATGGSGSTASSKTSGLITLNADLTLSYTGSVTSGGPSIGNSTMGTFLTGAGNLTSQSVSTSNNNVITGNNPGFTGNVTVGSGRLAVGSSTALSSANTVAVDSLTNTPTFNINGFAQTIAGLNNGANGGGTVTNTTATASTLTLGGSGTYSFGGMITATTPANLALTKSGNGTQTLSGTNTYTGATAVSGGTLLVNGSTAAASAVTVTNGGTILGGTGTVGGTVTVGGGSSGARITAATLGTGGTVTAANVAILNTGALTLTSTGIFHADVLDATGTAGTSYDQVIASGLTLGSSTLELNIASGLTFTDGQQLVLISDTAAGAINGTFMGLAQGTQFSSNGYTFTADYTAGDGNDFGIDFVATAVPEPATWTGAMLCGGMLIWSKRRRLQGLAKALATQIALNS